MTTSPSPTPVRPPVPGPLQQTAPTFIGMPKFPKGAREALANTQQRRNLAHATGVIRAKRARVVGELPQQHGIQVVGLGGEVSAKLLPQAPVILPPEVPMRHRREYAPGCAAEPLLTAASST